MILITVLSSTCNPASGACEEQTSVSSCAHGCDGGQCKPDPTPTPEQCLKGWRELDCPAPSISASYVGHGCVGTTGWFIEGNYFQHEKDNTGIADYGPQSIGANGNQRHWNIITPTKLCVTVAAAFKSTWVGKTIHVKNPDSKTSNSVVVEDRL